MEIDSINFSYDAMHKLFPMPVGHHISISKGIISKNGISKPLQEEHINQLNALIDDLFCSKIDIKKVIGYDGLRYKLEIIAGFNSISFSWWGEQGYYEHSPHYQALFKIKNFLIVLVKLFF